MVYCATFDCNSNISKNRVTCRWRKFPAELTLFKKCKLQTDEAEPSLLASRKLVSTAIRTGGNGNCRCGERLLNSECHSTFI